jgi:hypothetical protein
LNLAKTQNHVTTEIHTIKRKLVGFTLVFSVDSVAQGVESTTAEGNARCIKEEREGGGEPR